MAMQSSWSRWKRVCTFISDITAVLLNWQPISRKTSFGSSRDGISSVAWVPYWGYDKFCAFCFEVLGSTIVKQYILVILSLKFLSWHANRFTPETFSTSLVGSVLVEFLVMFLGSNQHIKVISRIIIIIFHIVLKDSHAHSSTQNPYLRSQLVEVLYEFSPDSNRDDARHKKMYGPV